MNNHNHSEIYENNFQLIPNYSKTELATSAFSNIYTIHYLKKLLLQLCKKIKI